MDRVLNVRIRELCGVNKRVDKRINEGIIRWFGHVERMENDWVSKRIYVGECADSRSVGRPWKRLIDTVKDCLRKRVVDVRQARRMVQDRCEWRGFVKGSVWDEPLTLMKCHICGLPQLYEALEGWKSICGRAHNLKGIKGNYLVFFSFFKLCFSFIVAHFMAWCVSTGGGG